MMEKDIALAYSDLKEQSLKSKLTHKSLFSCLEHQARS